MSLYSAGAMMTAISGISLIGWVTERFGELTGVAGIGATFLLHCLPRRLVELVDPKPMRGTHGTHRWSE